MSNFTQGPLVAKGGEVCTEEYEADGQVMHDHICCCEVINGESPNAKLIDAAPELLEALQACEKILSEIPLTVDLVEDLLFARSAIAKALGQ